MATKEKGTRGGGPEQHRQGGQQSQDGNQGQSGHRWSPEEAREQGKKGGQSRSKSS